MFDFNKDLLSLMKKLYLFLFLKNCENNYILLISIKSNVYGNEKRKKSLYIKY